MTVALTAVSSIDDKERNDIDEYRNQYVYLSCKNNEIDLNIIANVLLLAITVQM